MWFVLPSCKWSISQKSDVFPPGPPKKPAQLPRIVVVHPKRGHVQESSRGSQVRQGLFRGRNPVSEP